MMQVYWWLLSFLVIVRAVSHLEQQWHSWKQQHGKVYMDIKEEHTRRDIWMENLDKIRKFNNRAPTGNFTLAINQFTDLTFEEYRRNFLSPLAMDGDDEGNYTGARVHLPPPVDLQGGPSEYPDRVDWRQKGFVTPVKNQGTHCKQSSWAFSAAAAIEGQYYRENGDLVTLSEQQLIDCSAGFGNAGCHGGRMVNSFRYAIKNGGLCKESEYDYLGYKWHCMSEYCSSVAQCVDYARIKIGSEVALLDAVYRIGPLSVGVDATNYHFQFYSDGVYAESSCNSHSLNHGMLLVGYGVTYDGVEYWIVKNSWGTSWGDRGYMKIARNMGNMCGIATAASYPTVKQSD